MLTVKTFFQGKPTEGARSVGKYSVHLWTHFLYIYIFIFHMHFPKVYKYVSVFSFCFPLPFFCGLAHPSLFCSPSLLSSSPFLWASSCILQCHHPVNIILYILARMQTQRFLFYVLHKEHCIMHTCLHLNFLI